MGIVNLLRDDRGGQIFLGLLLITMVAVPILNMLPESHPLHISTYTVTLLGKYLSFALLAVAVDLAWGYLGILSLGHGAFFAPWAGGPIAGASRYQWRADVGSHYAKTDISFPNIRCRRSPWRCSARLPR